MRNQRVNIPEMRRGKRTAAGAIPAAERFVRGLGLVPVMTHREIMGFSVSRT